MGIKATNQITIVDLSDAYSVMLTSEAYTFVCNVNGAGAGKTCVTSAVKITFTTTANIAEACEAIIPVTVDDITINKKFSFAVAKMGATGAKGDQGVSITNVTPYYLASSAATGVKNTDTGFTTVMQTTDVTKKYLWSYQLITYSNNTTSKTDAVIISTHGATGAKGDDAVSLTITTSNGNVFKNNTGTTVLTAHVFKGAVEQTISDAGVVAGGLGTVKWTYDNGGTTETKAAKTLTVSAKDVLNAQTYTCELE